MIARKWRNIRFIYLEIGFRTRLLLKDGISLYYSMYNSFIFLIASSQLSSCYCVSENVSVEKCETFTE